ncbi:MAG: hypothetical protein WBH51_01430 [Mycolicibacter algericus]|uniref:hypothetical protein n=1 Tax=Mycolicibacter algericus TaxID=1288388 RepID=UPI003C75F960
MTGDDHEVRKLRWTVKQLGRQLGKAGATIYAQRCQIEELRALVDKSRRGDLRRLERLVIDLADENAILRGRLAGVPELPGDVLTPPVTAGV